MDSATPSSLPARWAPRFFAIWTGQAFSLFGSMLVQFALVWWLTQRTGSATVLATATLAALLPGVIIGPFAGALVDRWDRRRVMIAADGVIALATLGLVGLAAGGALQVWHIYVAMFVRAVAGGFHWPAMQASTTLLAPREQLARIAGLNQTLQGITGIVSPPLGALLLGVLPLYGVLAIDVITAALAIAPLLFVSIPQPERRGAAGPITPAALWGDVRFGLRYLWSWPGLFLMLCLATLINFLVSPAFTLLPILVTKHFGGGALQLGWLEAALGVGAVLGGLVLSTWGGFRRRIYTTLVGLIGMGLGVLLMGLVPADLLPLAVAAMFITGFMGPITNGPVMALVQTVVAPEVQGRVFTVIGSISSAMTPLSMLVAGPLADRFGVQAWFIVGGIGCVAMGIIAALTPAIRHLEDGRQRMEADAKAGSKRILTPRS